MQLYQLKPIHKNKGRKRVGRGGRRGTYSGRGLKGQKSRAGRKPRPGFAGGDSLLAKRMPKQKGKRGSLNIRKGVKKTKLPRIVVDLEKINKEFKSGEIVSPKSLLEKGLISKIKNKTPEVKILGKGKLEKGIKFEQVKLSKSIKPEKKIVKKKSK